MFRVTRYKWLMALMTLCTATSAAWAVKVGDITHLQGSRTNKVMGFGLVVGLQGTGDGGQFAPAMRALAQVYKHYGVAAISLEEMNDVQNVAIVQVEATLPSEGVREGDQVDVQVSSVGSADSLMGGRLFLTPLFGPNPDDTRVMAMAGGSVLIENPEIETSGRIINGATIEQNWIHNYIALGGELSVYRAQTAARPLDWIHPNEPYITFVIDEPWAEWAVAHTIAQIINEENSVYEMAGDDSASQIAVAFDPRTVVVRVPRPEQSNPAPFLARLENLALLMPLTEARVTINHATGTMIITGDAEISPVTVTHKGLTITTMVPKPPRDENNPQVVEQRFVPVDPQKKGGARLTDLVEALNQLHVPAADRIAIIEQLHRTGKLHARLEVER